MAMTQAILQRIEQCYALAEQQFERSFTRPQVSLCLRGKAAGMAHIGRNLLRFNQQLYLQNREDFLRQTVAHEVAHLLAYELYGIDIKPHGTQWQGIMHNLFQLPASRCHNYQIAPRLRTFYLYDCQCQQHEFTAQRHARVRRGYQYACRKCRQPLRFSGEAGRRLVGG